MEKATEQKSIVSRSARLLFYSSPVAIIVLFAVTFYVLSEHHSKLHELESSRAPDIEHDSYGNRVDEILHRSARQFGFGINDAIRGFVKQVVEEVVAEKVRKRVNRFCFCAVDLILLVTL